MTSNDVEISTHENAYSEVLIADHDYYHLGFLIIILLSSLAVAIEEYCWQWREKGLSDTPSLVRAFWLIE